ncbi:MAG: serine hydrolase domain-containing protein [Gemmatimonadota bacterium]
MLLALAIMVLQGLPADTLLAPGVILLGEEIETPTYVADRSTPESVPIGSYASMTRAPFDLPDSPVHLIESPGNLGFTDAELRHAIDSIESEVYRGGFPGAAVAIGRWSRTVLERGIGTHDRVLGSPAVDPDRTIYDLASLTKVVATTAAVMLLVEDGRMLLDAPVSRYLPHFGGGDKDRVTIRHLLTHTSGLPAWINTSALTEQQSLMKAISAPLRSAPGERVEYSDVGFVVLWAATDAVSAVPLPELLQWRVYGPLEMWSTGFAPGADCERCAPTLDEQGYRGIVHDPTARNLGGVTGNAGLFSTAHDLSRFAAMLANGGELDGVRVFEKSTIDEFTRRQPRTRTRALGWDTPDARGRGAGGLRISQSGFGHTGFTGTSLWIDPERGTWAVLLANRTLLPRGPNRMQAIRRELNDRVASSVDLARDR